MQLFLKKHFWLLRVGVVAVCALLAANATNHLIEARFLLGGDAKSGAAKPSATARFAEPAADTALPTKDAAVVVARNIFCSSCLPVVAEAAGPDGAGVASGSGPPSTTLPLALLATSVVANAAHLSAATVANSQTFHAGSYWLGDAIPGAGAIVSITPRWIDFQNDTAKRVERLDLLGAVAPRVAAKTDEPAKTDDAAGTGADLIAEADSAIKKIDDNTFEISRAYIDKVLADPSMLMRQARVVPSVKDKKGDGVKLYAVRPNSLFAKIGLQNGDTLHSINGFELTSLDKGLEVYQKLKSATSLSVQTTRRGQPVTMQYTIK